MAPDSSSCNCERKLAKILFTRLLRARWYRFLARRALRSRRLDSAISNSYQFRKQAHLPALTRKPRMCRSQRGTYRQLFLTGR